MIVNIIGLPRTGTTYLFRTIFRGVHKIDLYEDIRKSFEMEHWNEVWIPSTEDRHSEKLRNRIKGDIGILSKRSVEAVKTHYEHLTNMKVNFPDLFQRLNSIESYNVWIYRSDILETALSSFIFTTGIKDHIYNKDGDKNPDFKKVVVDKNVFLKKINGIISANNQLFENPLKIAVDEVLNYESIPDQMSELWHTLKLSNLPKFKFNMPKEGDPDLSRPTSYNVYEKADIIENYNELKELTSELSADLDFITVKNGMIYPKNLG